MYDPNEAHHVALLERLAEREAQTPKAAMGIPGVCVMGFAAPDCIVIVETLFGAVNYGYCLN